jgi:hypothetical protein
MTFGTELVETDLAACGADAENHDGSDETRLSIQSKKSSTTSHYLI